MPLFIEIDSNELKAVCHGIIRGINIETPFHLPNSNGCLNCGVECPITSGMSYNYTTSLPVLHIYPKLSVDVKWQLIAENDDVIVCVIIPAKIT